MNATTRPRLPATLAARGRPEFADTLKRELAALPVDRLPLTQALRQGSHVLDQPVGVRLIGADADQLRLRVGIFFASLIAGCNCADDPSPVEPLPEYCELLVEIDADSAEAIVSLLPD